MTSSRHWQASADICRYPYLHSKTNTPQMYQSTGEYLPRSLGGGDISGTNTATQREGDRLRAAGNPQLNEDVADMWFDGGWTNGQPAGDLRVV